MQVIYLQDVRLLEWACKRTGSTFAPANCRWVTGLVDGSIAWVAVYSHFSERNCNVTLATDGSKRWASRATFRAIVAAPFKQWGCLRITMIVDERNAASLAMMRKKGRFTIGAVEEGRMRDLFAPDVDGIVFGLLKKDCQWI